MAFDNHTTCRYFLSVSENIRLSAVRFGADGLVPVVTQESRSGEILMVAYANRDALDRIFSTGLAHYFSRSRGTLWLQGETSGHVQLHHAGQRPWRAAEGHTRRMTNVSRPRRSISSIIC